MASLVVFLKSSVDAIFTEFGLEKASWIAFLCQLSLIYVNRRAETVVWCLDIFVAQSCNSRNSASSGGHALMTLVRTTIYVNPIYFIAY